MNSVGRRRFPSVPSLEAHALPFAKIVAATSYLPHPDTVKNLGGAVFPTARARKLHPRLSTISLAGETVGMYDDNATPAWALFCSHGLEGTRPKGWTLSHVWPHCDDIRTYTHLANLILIPEPLAALTDKQGPLTGFLRWHAWQAYGWKPDKATLPSKPTGYDGVTWRYLEKIDDPRESVRRRLEAADNQRTRVLRPIMERLGMI